LYGSSSVLTDLNDTAVQDMMKNHIAVALDTLVIEEVLINLKYSKAAEKLL
jgi:hypothetical protein